jgi:hypothetical protein
MLAHPPVLWRTFLSMTCYELSPGVSWLAVTPSVIRYLWATGQEMSARQGKALEGFAFSLGAEHPAYAASAGHLVRTRPPYAWYVRVPDLPAFIRHVAPALEQSLAASPAAGHSGELMVQFYRAGLRLVLAAGRLAEVQPWDPPDLMDGDAAFPGLTFLQLLFGYRSLEELRYAFADCWADDAAAAVLTGLFPKQVSTIWPVS